MPTGLGARCEVTCSHRVGVREGGRSNSESRSPGLKVAGEDNGRVKGQGKWYGRTSQLWIKAINPLPCGFRGLGNLGGLGLGPGQCFLGE